MALTNAQKQRAHRQRQAERGLVHLQEWVTADQARTITAYLANLAPAPSAATTPPVNDKSTAGEIARLRAELEAAHERTDYALALAETFIDARMHKKRIDADILARQLVFAAQLRAELDAARAKLPA